MSQTRGISARSRLRARTFGSLVLWFSGSLVRSPVLALPPVHISTAARHTAQRFPTGQSWLRFSGWGGQGALQRLSSLSPGLAVVRLALARRAPLAPKETGSTGLPQGCAQGVGRAGLTGWPGQKSQARPHKTGPVSTTAIKPTSLFDHPAKTVGQYFGRRRGARDGASRLQPQQKRAPTAHTAHTHPLLRVASSVRPNHTGPKATSHVPAHSPKAQSCPGDLSLHLAGHDRWALCKHDRPTAGHWPRLRDADETKGLHASIHSFLPLVPTRYTA